MLWLVRKLFLLYLQKIDRSRYFLGIQRTINLFKEGVGSYGSRNCCKKMNIEFIFDIFFFEHLLFLKLDFFLRFLEHVMSCDAYVHVVCPM